MMERAGETADNFEAEGLPERDRPFVGAHHKIKLHGGEAAFAGAIERMRAHRTRHASAAGRGSSYVATIGNVRAAALLVSLQEIRAEDVRVFFRDKDFVTGSKPIIEGILARHVSRERVCLAGSDRGLQDRPDGVRVGGQRCTADLHSSLSQRKRYFVNLG